jgi:hypothetical protein
MNKRSDTHLSTMNGQFADIDEPRSLPSMKQFVACSLSTYTHLLLSYSTHGII